jgi:predicted peroxiredoxin
MKDKQGQLIIITKGREDGGHAMTLGIKLAVSFQAIGTPVSIFLTLGGTRWAFRGTASSVFENNDMALEQYFEQYAELGGELMVCSPCLTAYCAIPDQDEEEQQRSMRKNANYVGLATVAERLMTESASVF